MYLSNSGGTYCAAAGLPGSVSFRTFPAGIQWPHIEDVYTLHLPENLQTLEPGRLFEIAGDGAGRGTGREEVGFGGNLCGGVSAIALPLLPLRLTCTSERLHFLQRAGRFRFVGMVVVGLDCDLLAVCVCSSGRHWRRTALSGDGEGSSDGRSEDSSPCESRRGSSDEHPGLGAWNKELLLQLWELDELLLARRSQRVDPGIPCCIMLTWSQ